jgi:hypothetical protein
MLSSNPLKKMPKSSTKRSYRPKNYIFLSLFRMIFLQKQLFIQLALFATFEVEHGGKGSKKRKKGFVNVS